MKTIHLSFIFAITLCLTSPASAEPAQQFKIGVMLCQSGNCADWGTAALKGVRLATETLNSNGGVRSKNIELVVEDTAESISGAQAVSAFQSLLAKDITFFIGPSWSPAALAIGPIAAKRNDIIVLTPSASAREFSRSAPHMFNMRAPEELATRALARYAFNHGKKRVAIFSSLQPAESTQGRIFEDEFQKLGGEITIKIEENPTEPDLKSDALKIVRTKPDAIFLMNYNQMETGIKSLNALKYNGMRMAISLDESRITSARGLLEGIIVARAADPTEEFKAKFKTRYNEAPGLSAENGYDAVMILAQAIQEANSFQVSEVVTKLQQGNYSGATGQFSFNSNREVVQAPVLFVVKNGGLLPIPE